MTLDLLAPVARQAGLEDVTERATTFLQAQYEPSGVVRYHGRTGPEARCKAITPDADDTALVWLVAPAPGNAGLDSALQIIDQYKNENGLYFTWLAPPEEHVCTGKGAVPNPIDLVVQMHVMMLLSRHAPALARAHCASLKQATDGDQSWPYYRVAPIVPILRQADLSELGCDVQVPAPGVRSAVDTQQVWIELAELLRDLRLDRPTASRDRIRAVLTELAADENRPMIENPPLLYHGDLDITQRYYWSRDVGYALWLRLYFESLE